MRPPIVFLDIDGVLLPFGEGIAPQVDTLAAPCLAALAHILEATGAHVVLSSTWRCDEAAVACIRANFAAFGEPLASVDLASRADPTLHVGRQVEIAHWLDRASEVLGGDGGAWVVLDDMDCERGAENAAHAARFEGRCVLAVDARHHPPGVGVPAHNSTIARSPIVRAKRSTPLVESIRAQLLLADVPRGGVGIISRAGSGGRVELLRLWHPSSIVFSRRGVPVSAA